MLSAFKSNGATAIVTFLAWTLTSFLCHECAKIFLTGFPRLFEPTYSDLGPVLHVMPSVIVTSIQCLTCVFCVSISGAVTSTPVAIFVVGHVLATLATNSSMTYIEAASTLAIKLTEPVTMAVAHHIVFETSVTIETIVSIPLIIFGSLLFSVKTTFQTSDTAGIVLAFLSNLILTARNVAIKKHQVNTAPVQLRSRNCISALLCVQMAILLLVYILENEFVIPVKCSFILGALFVSGLCHVAYSYISTIIVLKVMNVISHSIANICKRLLVVLLLYGIGKRVASSWNMLGLTLAVIGLYIYIRGQIITKMVSTNTQDGLLTSKSVQRGLILCLSVIAMMSLIHHNAQSGTSFFSQLQQKMNVSVCRSFSPSNYMRDYSVEEDPKLAEFLTWRLVDHPYETDMRAKNLTTHAEIIQESRRVLINLLTDLIGPIQNVMLLEIATYSNKGDPAIAAGEVMLLREMNKTIVYYCETHSCNKKKNMLLEKSISDNFTKDNLVILMQGGGNVIGYQSIDQIRSLIMDRYPEHRKILLSQSIWLNKNSNNSLISARIIYSNRTNLTMFLRDRQSLEIAKHSFQGVKLILAPDMAFGLGALPRQMPPMYDIIWLRRKDQESAKYAMPKVPNNVSIHISDWLNEWSSNVGTRDMETSFLIAFSGIHFLQRGRVVVTDRLHGHILSTLLNIPHVLIDNPPFYKLSSFHQSWTYSLSNSVIINNGTNALDAAIKLLSIYDRVLPPVGPIDMNRFTKL
ncbi:pyruvyl transferase 1 [Biomphalaria glabrata]|nr:pyruvyl transferase 1 [Biomphalaria glabrata]